MTQSNPVDTSTPKVCRKSHGKPLWLRGSLPKLIPMMISYRLLEKYIYTYMLFHVYTYWIYMIIIVYIYIYIHIIYSICIQPTSRGSGLSVPPGEECCWYGGDVWHVKEGTGQRAAHCGPRKKTTKTLGCRSRGMGTESGIMFRKTAQKQ